MPSTATDIIDGISTSTAVKPPAKTASVSSIVLSGLQTIDSVVLAENDRVLVNGQTDPIQNGIYVASSQAWERSKDFDGRRDARKGTLIFVISSATYYRLVTDDTVVIGTSAIHWQELLISGSEVNYYSTVNALRSISSPLPNQVVEVAGYWTPGDGGGGEFYWNDTSTAAEDGGLVFQVTGIVTGRWIRVRQPGILNVLWFGARGTGYPTDDHAAFVATHAAAFGSSFALSARGARIIIPTTPTGYYLSDTWNITNPVTIAGDNFGWPTVTACGPKLEFAPDKHGIILNGIFTYDDGSFTTTPTWFGTQRTVLEYVSVSSRGGQDGTLNGGTGVTAHGIWVRNGSTVRYCNVGGSSAAFGFKGDAFRAVGTSAGGVLGELEGLNNLAEFIRCTAWYNGGHGFYLSGGDANVCLIQECDATLNGGNGFLDNSQTGNTYISCHAATNALGDYKSTNINASNLYLGCYQEGSNPVLSSLIFPSMVVGGELAGTGAFTLESTALIFGAAGSVRYPISHTNRQNAIAINTRLGSSTDDLSAFHFGLGVFGSETGWYDLRWSESTTCWYFQFNNSPALMWLPATTTGFRAFAPAFSYGLYFGLPTGDEVFRGVAAAAPVAGTWKWGDHITNQYPAVGQPKGWFCTVAGTPGTWISEGNL